MKGYDDTPEEERRALWRALKDAVNDNLPMSPREVEAALDGYSGPTVRRLVALLWDGPNVESGALRVYLAGLQEACFLLRRAKSYHGEGCYEAILSGLSAGLTQATRETNAMVRRCM